MLTERQHQWLIDQVNGDIRANHDIWLKLVTTAIFAGDAIYNMVQSGCTIYLVTRRTSRDKFDMIEMDYDNEAEFNSVIDGLTYSANKNPSGAHNHAICVKMQAAGLVPRMGEYSAICTNPYLTSRALKTI